ncbi:hypothetical protein CEXT_769361 [Caerostris extrusa]|uniref:Uncharacterized protein n=1 Tax=Caerostris extrusa TaxID=172846 RepID=A0AAV4P470_CAEEX|nr:hypothetical protein CEXT_769361 [Caerostris extrusa]
MACTSSLPCSGGALTITWAAKMNMASQPTVITYHRWPYDRYCLVSCAVTMPNIQFITDIDTQYTSHEGLGWWPGIPAAQRYCMIPAPQGKGILDEKERGIQIAQLPFDLSQQD